jgi:hypothetical protein
MSWESDRVEQVAGRYQMSAQRIDLLSRPPEPPGIPIGPMSPSVITVFAPGLGIDGLVNVRGSQGVRVTSGPPPLPAAESSSTNGIEILTGETGNVTIQRGLLPEVDQKMEMTPTGVTIDGGAQTVTIKSLTRIELSVCEGVAKITIDPSGVTIDALTINLSAQVMAQLQSIMTQVSGSAVTQISGGITMIG